MYCVLIQKTVKIANKSDHWVCTHSPEHGHTGVLLIRIHIRANVPWQNLWIDTNIDPRDIGQEWEIDTPTPPERYCVCIQRCNPPKGIKLFDCLINAAFVRPY